jgi:hypothetical protein
VESFGKRSLSGNAGSYHRNMSPEVAPNTSSPRWLAPAALVVAVVAVALAIWALVRPTEESAASAQQATVAPQAPTETGQPSDAAKANACTAFDTVSKAVSMQTNADLGPDPVAKEAVAANARLATLGGGEYLLSRLTPDTPGDVADAIRAFANNLQEIGMNQLVGVPNTDAALAKRLSDAEAANKQIAELCK